ncbi:MAG TPA: hypothetical protein VFE58_13070 [Tepidisphaeraceae bacterium]|jgi:hypothetical protein|nr:hypothetical protein [Tepidisphaeraceae bacterium]
MIHYYKFRQDLLDPAPARDVYIKRPAGRGWPEECPPVRAANSFGFDLLANFDLTFLQSSPGKWRVPKDLTLESDFNWSPDDQSEGSPLHQQYAWFWEPNQQLPHKITPNVYKQISNQVKVSTYLFLKSDPNELLLMTDIPNLDRPFRATSAIIETDWYPASYPWHCVLELDRSQKRITIKKGDPLCRIIPVRRDTYFAKPMSPSDFDDFFSRGQSWLSTHGRPYPDPAAPLDITRTYSRQQSKSKFLTIT